MMSSLHLLAQTTESTFRLARLESMTEPWQWLLMGAVCVAVVVLIIVMYYRDSVELPLGIALLLGALRISAFIGLLVFFLHPEIRTEQKVVKASRVSLLVDVSQSMARDDSDSTSTSGPRRIDQVVDELVGGKFVGELRKQHDVVAYKFDEGSQPVELATFSRLVPESELDEKEIARRQYERAQREMIVLASVAGGFFVLSLIAGIVFLATRSRSRESGGASWALLASIVTVIVAVVVFAVANLRNPNISMRDVIQGENPNADESEETDGDEVDPEKDEGPEVDWKGELVARGAATRLGESLRYVINKERGGPAAAVVVFSDGANNAGIDPKVVSASARISGIPIYAVGLGSSRQPVNVTVADLEAPARVYPGDKFTLNGLLRAIGMEGRTVTVELVSSPVGAEPGTNETFEREDRVQLGADGEEVSVQFELTPEEQGRRIYTLRVSPPTDDSDRRDNEQRSEVEVVDRKNRVLLIAGGPTREFRFLRNQLYRDKDTIVHVLLQTGKPGISQEADELLFEFPDSADDLFEYDCILAFDPDWDALSVEQVKLVETFVAEQAGGLVVVAGPVHTPNWTRRPRGDEKMDEIKALYPVVFINRGAATIRTGRFGGDEAWQLAFSREGRDAEFLWLGESSAESEQSWAEFDGVYGYYGVKDPKPAATIYARFSDPETASSGGELPIYLASQMYGAGRVFFQASGEMWRIRAVDDNYFEQYYTKLIRWASQGRLLRDSDRGVLLVSKERATLGEHIEVRAILQDAQRNPLDVDEVAAVIVDEHQNTREALTLRKVQGGARPGMYAAQFTPLRDGVYHIEMRVPGALEDEILAKTIEVRSGQIELQNSQRNDGLLKEITSNTGGLYYVGMRQAMQPNNGVGAGDPLFGAIGPRDQETYLPGTSDREFEELLMTWLLGIITGLLCIEWLVRRLNKLA